MWQRHFVSKMQCGRILPSKGAQTAWFAKQCLCEMYSYGVSLSHASCCIIKCHTRHAGCKTSEQIMNTDNLLDTWILCEKFCLPILAHPSPSEQANGIFQTPVACRKSILQQLSREFLLRCKALQL